MNFSKLARLTAAALLTAALTGCLQPVHGTRFGPASAALKQVVVARIDGYMGYALKTELDYLLSGGQAPSKSGRYLLNVKTRETKATTVVDSSTGLAQVGSLQVEAVYVLLDRDNGDKIRTSGKTFASAAYDRSQMRFASMRAERDTEDRLGKALAERLKIIIATALASEAASGPAKAPELSAPDAAAPAAEPGEED